MAGRLKVAGALVVASLAVGALILLLREAPPDQRPLPPMAADQPVPGPRYDDFAGAAACAACHQEQYALWRQSTHGRAGGPPGRELLLRAFDGTPIRFRDAIVTPRVSRGKYLFDVDYAAGERHAYTVDGVVGGGHMVGGGTQGFFTPYADGTLRFLPFEIVKQDTAWFCNTGTRANRGWVRITSDMALADCGDWPPTRVLGTSDRFGSCQECHGSQIELIRGTERPFTTRYRELSINCESCHGPARAHVQSGGKLPLAALDTLDKQASIAVCFRCHALKDAVTPGYLPGRDFERHYSLKLPLAGASDLHVDGRTRTFAYQQGHLYSDCYLNGSLNCVDCHEPHGQGYRDISGRPLSSRFDNGQCTACHASKAADVRAHTYHAPQSAGSRCVSCHMPYLQQPDVGTGIRYARSDHSIPSVRPVWDARVSTENACRTCHRDMSADSVGQVLASWYGDLKPQRPAITALQEANGNRDLLAHAIELALRDGNSMVMFHAFAQYLGTILRTNEGGLSRGLQRALRAGARHEDVDVAAGALALLHALEGSQRNTRSFLIERVANSGERATAVRQRWSILLGYQGDNAMSHGNAHAAIGWYAKALEAWPNNARTLLSLGIAYAGQGDYASALQAYNAGLAVDPRNVLLYVNKGIALAATGDVAGAEAAYLDAQRVDPYEALSYFNLANMQLRSGQTRSAIGNYERAVALNPAIAAAHLNLARAHVIAGDAAAAVRALQRALRYHPGNAPARQLLDQLSASAR